MRVLFIAPRLPVPTDTGGKIRTFNIIKQIAQNCELDLVCFSFDKHDEEYVKELEVYNIRVHLVALRNPGIIKKISKVLSGALPFPVDKYCSERMESKISSLVSENDYDIVHVDHAHMAHYQKNFNGTPRFLDEHNVEYKILERCASVEKSLLKRKIYESQARKMKRFEAEVVKQFSGCFAVSDDDRATLNRITDGIVPIYTLPNGVDTEYFQSPVTSNQSQEQEDMLVFTGSMEWLPNHDAVVYFCREILPLIWERKNDVKFYIVGKGASRGIIELGKNDERLVVTGRVDDVRPFVTKAKIFVAPLRIGGGTRLKILEAMSMRKAVVSTSIGAEGIDYHDGQDIVIADNPGEFADKTCALLNDGSIRGQIGLAGRQLVNSYYDWEIIGHKLLKVYEEYHA